MEWIPIRDFRDYAKVFRETLPDFEEVGGIETMEREESGDIVDHQSGEMLDLNAFLWMNSMSCVADLY